MIYPHRIRLRGPWECVPLQSASGILPMPRRVTMPGRLCDHGLASFAGTVRFVRTFGKPGQIDDYERVWLTCRGMSGAADVQLNDCVIAKNHAGPLALEVTPLLRQRNRLEVTIATDSDQDGLWGEVALEVRCSAYLKDMVARRLPDGVLEVTGSVAGTCQGPLELYGVADRVNCHYAVIEASAEGTPFRFAVAPRNPPITHLRVELVNVATAWYTWEAPPATIE